MPTQEKTDNHNPHEGSYSLFLWAAPLLSLSIGWFVHTFCGLEAPASITLGIALWTALWWIFEGGAHPSCLPDPPFPPSALWYSRTQGRG